MKQMKPSILGLLGTICLASVIFSPTASAQPRQVVERGPNYRVIQMTRMVTNQFGEIMSENKRYTEMEAGMHRFEHGKWVDSEAVIEVNSEGYATATRGVYTVIFSPNFNSPGTIDLLTPQPQQTRLRSHVLGIFLSDSATGRRVMVAGVKDSIGELLPPNRIIYRSAFYGLDADMLFIYEKGVVEADLIIKENLALPEGFAPESSRLELVTEFSHSATPDVTQCAFTSENGSNLVDDSLIDFGGMMMVPGKAFSVDGTASASGGLNDTALHVLKQWRQMNGKQVLIESVSWTEAEAHMKSLPKAAVNDRKPTRQASVGRRLPTKQMALKHPGSLRVASLPYKQEGFVMDYIVVVTQPSWTFESGQTYLVTNAVTISSSSTFQSGAIIKFDRLGSMTLSGTVSCPTNESVYLTARDDTSIGEDTSTGALTGYYGNPYYIQLYNMFAAVLKRMNIRYAKEGVTAYTPCQSQPQTVQDSRFENCEKGVTASLSTMNLTNLIFCNTLTNFYNYGGSSFNVSAVTTNCDGNVRFTTLTDGKLLTGQTNIPIEVVSGDFDVAGVKLFANGNEAAMYSVNPANAMLTWNTAFSTNGVYSVNLLAEFYFSSVTGAVTDKSVG